MPIDWGRMPGHEPRHRRLSRTADEQRRRVLELAKVVSATLGGDFLNSLVEHVSTTLDVDCAYVAELTGGPRRKLKTVAVYRDDALAQNFEQTLLGTASAQVIEDGAVSVSVDAARIFPLDPFLQSIGARGYVGFRLCDSHGQVIGLIAVVNQERLRDLPLVNSVLQAFASRAAAELERKRSYEMLRESEERYRAFVSSSLDAMWRIELDNPVLLDTPEEEQIERIYRDGYVDECNDALARLVGMESANDLVGTPFANLFSPTDRHAREELRALVRSRYKAATVETSSLDASGRRSYRLRTQIGIVENNRLLRIWGTTRDVTELRRAVIAMEASERRFREVLEKIPIPAVILETSGKIIFSNDSLTQMMGSPDLIGRYWPDLLGSVQDRENWAALLSGLADLQPDLQVKSVILLRQGVSRVILWHVLALRDESGEIAGLAAIGKDHLANPFVAVQPA
jgi:PAS domain S-box-containing protein